MFPLRLYMAAIARVWDVIDASIEWLNRTLPDA